MKFFKLICLCLIFSTYLYGQRTNKSASKEGISLPVILDNIEFPNHLNIDTVLISVFGSGYKSDSLYNLLYNQYNEYEEKKRVIEFIPSIGKYALESSHIIIVNQSVKDNFDRLGPLRTEKFLMAIGFVGDNKYMLSITGPSENPEIHINLAEILRTGYGIGTKLIWYVENENQIYELFNNYEKQIAKLETKLIEQRQLVESQEDLIYYLRNEIERNKSVIENQNINIEQKEQELNKLKVQLKSWNDSVKTLKGVMNKYQRNIGKLSADLAYKNENILELNQAIEEKEISIDALDKSINDKKRELIEQMELNRKQSDTISTQRTKMLLLIGLLVLSIALALVALWFYRIKKQSNLELSLKNESISRQNEKIELQKEKIEQQNQELHGIREMLEETVNIRTLELKEAKEKAEIANRLKTSFLTNMSHEIRTPLNAILGFTSLLVNDEIKDAEKENFIKYVDNSSQTLMNILDDILIISLIETDQISVSLTSVNINKLLLAVYQYFNVELERQEKEHLQLNITTLEEDVFLTTDEDKLKQVLINLIHNAVKYTETGIIEFGCKQKNGKWQFYVQDTGIGISDHQLQYIFEPFNKVEEDKTKLYRGIGLGLTICKKLVELLEGTIGVVSEKGKGTTFHFNLPNK